MDMNKNSTAIIILAAGLGTRMNSKKAKVLHTIHNKPMINYVVKTALSITDKNVIVVTGYQADQVRSTILSYNSNVLFAYQDKQLGTGHAVMCAMPQIDNSIENIVILCGDVPLLSPDTISHLINTHRENNYDVTVLGVDIQNPTGYGRMITDQTGDLIKIVEEADASTSEREIKTINSGIYCVGKSFLKNALNSIKPNNAQKEYYLTDIIGIGKEQNRKIGLCTGSNSTEVMGVNSIQDLKAVEDILEFQKGKIS